MQLSGLMLTCHLQQACLRVGLHLALHAAFLGLSYIMGSRSTSNTAQLTNWHPKHTPPHPRQLLQPSINFHQPLSKTRFSRAEECSFHLFDGCANQRVWQYQAEEGTLAEIKRRHGDHLYAKHSYDSAMEQYMATIAHLEPSYVIRRFLDAQRIHNLTSYLEALHTQVCCD